MWDIKLKATNEHQNKKNKNRQKQQGVAGEVEKGKWGQIYGDKDSYT